MYGVTATYAAVIGPIMGSGAMNPVRELYPNMIGEWELGGKKSSQAPDPCSIFFSGPKNLEKKWSFVNFLKAKIFGLTIYPNFYPYPALDMLDYIRQHIMH